MNNIDVLNDLNSLYGESIVLDIKRKMSCSICFYFDLKRLNSNITFLKGNLSQFGLDARDQMTFQDLLSMIETDNALAEVEGKNNFIDTTIQKLIEMNLDTFLYIPFKHSNTPVWLYIKFENIKKDSENHLILAHVIRVFYHTPDEITYYQKTYQDPMTKLFTRETLKLHLKNLSDVNNKYILYLDIDGFKLINDRYGHSSGDQFIKDLANFFISKWEHNVIYYRLGGDEFLVYVYDHAKDQVFERAKQLIHDISNISDHAKKCRISVSVGIVKITEDNKSYYRLLDLGDQTMYQSKNRGKGNISYYE